MEELSKIDPAVGVLVDVQNTLVINAIKAEVAQRLNAAGQPPKVLTAGATVGAERAEQLFESAYDEHARRIAKLYQQLGA